MLLARLLKKYQPFFSKMCLCFIAPVVFTLALWACTSISNALMHAMNGNIDAELYESIIDNGFNRHNAYFLISNMLPFQLFRFEGELIDSRVRHAINSVNLDQLLDEARVWDDRYKYERFMTYFVFYLRDEYHTYAPDYVFFGVNSFRILQFVESCWQSYLLGNAGMHATNGNSVPQMRFPGFPVDISIQNDELTDAMDTLTKSLDSGIDIKVSHAIDVGSQEALHEALKSVVASVSSTQINASIGIDSGGLLDVASIVLLIGSAVNYHHNPSTTNSYIFGAAVLFGISKHGILDVDLSRFLSTGTKPQVDSNDLQSIVTAVATLLCGYTCVKSPSEQLMSNLIKSLSSFGRHTDSLEKIIKWSVTAVETCVNYIRRHFLGTGSLSFIETGRAELDDFLKRVRSLDDTLHLNTFTYTVENSHMVHTMYQDATKLLGKLPRDKDSAPLCAALNHAITFIHRLKVKMDAMNLNLDGIRQEPAAILMRGPPGMGKSQAMEHLCYRLLPHLVPEDKIEQALKTPGHYIYNRQAENVFWEGFDYEKVITQFDDIGQARDIQGNPDNEIMNVIRAINIFQYNVHMAGIEQKGNVKFYSKLVVANTNMKTFEFQSIISPDAFFRRFDIIVDVVAKREYCTEETRDLDIWKRKIDFATLPIGCEGITSMHPDMLEFHGFDYFSQKLSGRVYSFDELTESLILVQQLKKKRFVQYQSELTTSKNKPQVDWSKFLLNQPSVTFENEHINKEVKEFLRLFYKNPDYLHCSMMLSSWYHKHTGFDHKLEYIIAVYLSTTPEFFEAHAWDFSVLAEYLLDELHDIKVVPVIGVVYSEGIFNDLYTSAKEFFAYASNFLSENHKKLETVALCLVPISIALTVGVQVYRFYKHVQPDAPVARAEYNPKSTKTKVTYKKPPSMKYAKSLIPNQPQAMLSFDKSNIEILNKVVARNSYEIVLPNQEERCGFAVFIKGNVLMVNRHFVTLCVARVDEDPNFVNDVFRLRKPNTEVTYSLPVTSILEFTVTDVLEDQDIAFILAPKHVPQHVDIVKYFMSRQEVHKYTDLIFRLIVNNHKDYRSWVGQAIPVDSIAIDDTATPYVIRNGYRYMATTQAGDCGSLFTLCSSHSNARKILGIHAAGNPDGYAYATAVFEEDLLEALELYEEQISVDIESASYPQCSLPFINKSLSPLYLHTSRVPRPMKSSYHKSPLYGKVCPVKTSITRTRPFWKNGVLIDPLDIALDKFCKNKTYIPQELLQPITEQLYDDIVHASQVKPDKRILTFEEAILGIENDPIFGSISRTTSPGFPFTHDARNKGKGKTHWFGTKQEYDLDTQACKDLKRNCLQVLEDAINGIRHEHIFADNPKDETLPTEKVEANKVRLFNACPLVLLIVTRMLFGSFVRWYVANKIFNGSAVGVNPYSLDWELIRQQLEKFGSIRNKGAGDYKSFDGSEIPQIHLEVLELIQKYYGDDGYTRARFVIFLELINSKHINGSHVYEWPSSLPSGHPLTTIVNNLYNHYCFRYCWLASHDYDPSCLPDFTSHVYLVVLGDDNVFSVSSEKLGLFNMLSIEENMLKIGMTYTSDDKTSKIGSMKLISEITFLKRSYRVCPILRRCVAPLSLTSITEMLNWCGGDNPNTTVEQNVKNAFRELSLHEPQIFDVFTAKIIRACETEQVKLPLSTSRYQNLIQVSKLDSIY